MLEQLESLHKKLLTTETNDINMFEVLGIQNNEVLICRAIGFLLMPDSQYKIGTEPLKSFLSILSNKSYSEDDYKRAHIVLEDPIDNDRRVDICIYISGDIYPIEVKIWAEDQPSQLYDYYNYYNDKYNNAVPKIYYLTPDNHIPSEDSVSNKNKSKFLKKEDVVCLSFHNDIRKKWLSLLKCDNPGYMLLVKQFKEVIQTMCAKVKNRDLIYEELKLNTDDDFKVDEKIKTVLNLMALNQQELWHSIRDKYLRNALKYDESNYELLEDKGADINDNFCLYAIKNKTTNQKLIWICVETNLYVVCKQKLSGFTGADEYYWRYISPRGQDKKFNLKTPNTSILEEDKIDIDKYIIECEEKIVEEQKR